MVKEYRTLYQRGIEEIIIEKSRFIGYSTPIISEEEAIKFIEEIKTKHKDATHNVPAYIVGERNEIQRYSDDGEPSGTAGIPSLEVLKKEDLRNVAIVVTRYFGGIKLGAGGLIRAYTKGAKVALDAGKIVIKRVYQMIHIKVDYTLLGKLQNEILQNNYLINNTEYDDSVHFFVYVQWNEVETFKKQVVEWTNAQCFLEEKQEEYLTELDGKIVFT
ncbi:MAG: YigZ family protein [Clostridiaceae bacterium]|nr:YigZ family protein [Clostridiaceae bacterium]